MGARVMTIRDRIEKYHLPLKQRRVLTQILSDIEVSSFLSGNELCEKFDISFSSLSRMARSLQYSGFPELKKDIEKLYKLDRSPSNRAESFLQNSQNSSVRDLVLKNEIRNIESLGESLQEEGLINIAKRINEARQIALIGVGSLAPLVQKFSHGLKLLGKIVQVYDQIGFSKRIELSPLGESDFVILFSLNRELREHYEVLNTFSDTGVESLLLTDSKAGKLNPLATYSMALPSQGQGSLNSLTSYLVFTNILESYIFSMDKFVHVEKLKQVEENWDSLPLFI